MPWLWMYSQADSFMTPWWEARTIIIQKKQRTSWIPMSAISWREKPCANLSLFVRVFPRSSIAKNSKCSRRPYPCNCGIAGWPSNSFKMFASCFKTVRFNLKDALDFFIAQTTPVEVFAPLKTWLYSIGQRGEPSYEPLNRKKPHKTPWSNFLSQSKYMRWSHLDSERCQLLVER